MSSESKSDSKWIWFRVEDSTKYMFKIYDDRTEAIDDFRQDIREYFNPYNIDKYVELGKFYRPNYVSVVVEYTDTFELEVNDRLIEDIKYETEDPKRDKVTEWIMSNIISNRTGASKYVPVEIVSIDDIMFDVKEWKTWDISWINNRDIEYLDIKSDDSEDLDDIMSKGNLRFTCQIGSRANNISELTKTLGQFRNYVSNLIDDRKTSKTSFQAVVRISDSKIKAIGEFKINPCYANVCPTTGFYIGCVGPVPSGKEANVFYGGFKFTINFDDIIGT